MAQLESDTVQAGSNHLSDVPDDALRPFAPGRLLRIGCGPTLVQIAADAGGRIAQITHAGVDWLTGYDADHRAMIGWGSYPMLPWAGRIRQGRFGFDGRRWQLAPNLGPHAIHGVGFALPWQVGLHAPTRIELLLTLPEDERWPFGGSARQLIEVGEGCLKMSLQVTAGYRAMPCVIGWHPWFCKPDELEFLPERMYPHDAEGMTVLPTVAPAPPPWDHCFINRNPIRLRRARQWLRLTSDCEHWVVFDQLPHSTAIEPQSGPPDGFNLESVLLQPGESQRATFLWEWNDAGPIAP